MSACAKKVAEAYLRDVEAFDLGSIINKFKKIRGPKLINQISKLLANLEMKPTPEEIAQAAAAAIKSNPVKTAFNVESLNVRLSLLTAIASLMLLAGIPQDTLAKNLEAVTKNPNSITQVVQKEAPKFSLYSKTFTLMGQTRTDIQLIDNVTGEIVEAKGFDNDKKGADAYLKSLQQKYPNAPMIN